MYLLLNPPVVKIDNAISSTLLDNVRYYSVSIWDAIIWVSQSGRYSNFRNIWRYKLIRPYCIYLDGIYFQYPLHCKLNTIFTLKNQRSISNMKTLLIFENISESKDVQFNLWRHGLEGNHIHYHFFRFYNSHYYLAFLLCRKLHYLSECCHSCCYLLRVYRCNGGHLGLLGYEAE